MAEPRGAVAGTFLAGELTAGEVQYPFDPPQLLLNPRLPSLISPPYTALAFRRPVLSLQGKTTDGVSRTTLAVNHPFLVLTARLPIPIVPPAPLMQRPMLELTGRSFGWLLDQTLVAGMPFLELTARRSEGVRPGMTPSVPVDVILVPSVPEEWILVPSVPVEEEEDWLLRPTTEVPA
jgi:hypothetical protein